jgi:hypothetical protein
MSAPDTQLTKIYGTTKEAGDMALAARIAASVLGWGLMSASGHQADEEEQERAEELRARRDGEAQLMGPTIEAMKSASAAGRILARSVPASELEKMALGEGLLGAGKAVAKALQPGWKTKALAIGGTAAAGLAGYKGLAALRDYANTEQGDHRWGSLRPLQHNINEWGYPSE